MLGGGGGSSYPAFLIGRKVLSAYNVLETLLMKTIWKNESIKVKGCPVKIESYSHLHKLLYHHFYMRTKPRTQGPFVVNRSVVFQALLLLDLVDWIADLKE